MDEAIVISEVQIMSAMENMCVQSLDPETFEMWCKVKNVLKITRKALGASPDSPEPEPTLPVWMPHVSASPSPQYSGELTAAMRTIVSQQAKIHKLLSALDALGVAIANAGYTWTPEMREIYEQATMVCFCIDGALSKVKQP